MVFIAYFISNFFQWNRPVYQLVLHVDNDMLTWLRDL